MDCVVTITRVQRVNINPLTPYRWFTTMKTSLEYQTHHSSTHRHLCNISSFRTSKNSRIHVSLVLHAQWYNSPTQFYYHTLVFYTLTTKHEGVNPFIPFLKQKRCSLFKASLFGIVLSFFFWRWIVAKYDVFNN